MGKAAIVVALCAGVGFLYLNIYVKLLRPEFAIINTLTELRYFFTNGFTVLVLTAFFLRRRGRGGQSHDDQQPDNGSATSNRQEPRQQKEKEGEQRALAVALASSVAIFGASRLWVDELPLVLQPYLVRAAITISVVFGALVLHDQHQGHEEGVSNESAGVATAVGAGVAGESLPMLRSQGLERQGSSKGIAESESEGEGELEEVHAAAGGGAGRSTAGEVGERAGSAARPAVAVFVSSGREVEVVAALLLVVYIATQILLW